MRARATLSGYAYSIVSGKIYYNGKRVAGAVYGRRYGYRAHEVDGVQVLAHRLAWKLVTGEWPEHEIDHIDRNGAHNMWINLREATHNENGQNRKVKVAKSGVKGIDLLADGYYQARLKHKGKLIYLGRFDNLEDARCARLEGVAKYFTHVED